MKICNLGIANIVCLPLCMAMLLSGCSFAIDTNARMVQRIKDEYGWKYTFNTLYQCAHADFHPSMETVYSHNGRLLRAFHVYDNFVLVQSYGDLTGDADLVLAVETKDSYVDREYLRPGLYLYSGVYKYETVDGTERIVRRFQQIE